MCLAIALADESCSLDGDSCAEELKVMMLQRHKAVKHTQHMPQEKQMDPPLMLHKAAASQNREVEQLSRHHASEADRRLMDAGASKTMLAKSAVGPDGHKKLQSEGETVANSLSGELSKPKQVSEVRTSDSKITTTDVATANTGAESRRLLVVFYVCLACYAVFAVAFELRVPVPGSTSRDTEGGKDALKVEKPRVLEWDAMKLLVTIFVTSTHMHGLAVNFGEQSPDPYQLQVKLFHMKSFTEWLSFSYYSVYMLPCFAFISGVFSQRVDKDSLLRVFCYTYGTTAMLFVLGELLHTATWGHVGRPPVGHVWYLVCLFWWRITLAPLLDRLRSESLYLRLLMLFFVAGAFLVAHDMFQDAMDLASLNSHYCFPCSDYFALGPFFALGLLMPAREWTTSLSSKKLQLLATFIVVAYYCGLWNHTYGAFFYDHRRIGAHWPIAPSPALALTPSRVLENLGIFAGKSIVTLAVAWFVAAITQLLGSVAPSVAYRFLTAGERTMYAYTLHFTVMQIADDVFCAGQVVRSIPLSPSGSVELCLGIHATSLVMVLLLSSRLTEALMHHVVMPFWMLDVLAMVGLSGKSRSSSGASAESNKC
eukprot:TRINITY_DN121007_c0_g1_i1.p1 TRINITY_DN121007_c0_g1~~TRINITY_DN121007_c0_g1_i1.p1  ORF type:complete len:627 (+),score=40.04 TRINITY_DN121007_c0_g1_i1:94-1881(+)